jgi:methylenetetrahydrofolate reductase (NADPH)
VTASPAKGIDATLDWAARLQADGFRAIPHLSARMIASRDVLAGLLARARDAGLTRAFVVGGDADEPGEYLDGLSLLQAMTELGHPFETLGCPAYRRATRHPRRALAQALRDKAPYVAHVTTQMDFRRRGRELVRLGGRRVRARGRHRRAGRRRSTEAASIAARSGSDAKRFLVKNLRS